MTLPERTVLLVALFTGRIVLHGEEPRYTFYDLGTLEYGTWADANDVNDQGVVVGSSLIDGEGRAYVWYNGVMTNIGQPIDLDWWMAEGTAISETGVVTGYGPPHVPIWPHAPIDQMDIPEGCMWNEAPNDINNSGMMIAGSCLANDGTNDFHPVVYWVEDGSAANLGFLPDSPPDAEGWARGVNDSGVIVGRLSYGLDGNRAFIWSDNVMSEIVNTLGGVASNAYAINNHGLVVGSAETADGFPAMSYDMNTGLMLVLGDGTALAMNDRGDAVGRDIIDLSASHAILYSNGEAIDLHEFMSPDLLTSRGEAINNYGWIVGQGDDVIGDIHAWLLVPLYDKGDYDGDGDVDFQDSGHFQRCFAAEPYIDGTLHVGCSVFDFDDDIDLDLDDYAAFQSAFTGPTAPNNNPNGPG